MDIKPTWTPTAEPALRDAVAALDRALEHHEPVSPDLLAAIGGELWRLAGLDADDIAAALEDALDDQAPLRLTITGAEAQHLPWELLRHPDPGIGFLSRHDWAALARRVRGSGNKAPSLVPRPLRVLHFVAAPDDLDPERARLDYEGEEALLFEALDGPIARGELLLDVAADGSLKTLIERLTEQRWHAVILSMHGTEAKAADGSDEWGLLFEHPDTARGHPVAGSVLAEALRALPAGHRPALMVLAACRSARAGEATGAAIPSVADALHTAGVERVLGMRASVSDRAASVFDAELFRRLVQGEDLGRALSQARGRMAQEGWSGPVRDGAAPGATQADPHAQWTLPVLLERTVGGPLLDRDAPAELVPAPPPPAVLIGDGRIELPARGAFIGRRAILRAHLRPFLDGRERRLLFTGPGGVGKTALAGWLARRLLEQGAAGAAPAGGSAGSGPVRILGFRAPFDLDAGLLEALRREAFDNTLDAAAEEALRAALSAERDPRERARRLLLSLATRPRPLCLLLDNLEAVQEATTLGFRPEHADSRWLVQTALDLPAPTRVLLTGRYALDGLPVDAHCPVGDAPLGDVLQRLGRLDWPAGLGGDAKRLIHARLGGNHRAIDWLARLLADGAVDQGTRADELLAALAAQQAPPDTPEAAVEVVLQGMRQNLLFGELRAQLTAAQDQLLRAASHYRIPVTEDGLRAVAADRTTLETDRDRLLAYALLEPSRDAALGLDLYQVPPIVRELLGADRAFPRAEARALHAAMGRYHRFQGAHVTRTLGDHLEAIHHLRAAGEHEAADALAEPVAGFYHRRGAFAEALTLVAPIVQRTAPPPPWWAWNRHGMCLLRLGRLDPALGSFERSLATASDDEARGAALNNIAQIHLARGDYGEALRHLEQSLAIARAIGDRVGEGAMLNSISQICDARGEYSEALSHLEQALAVQRAIGFRAGEGVTLSNIGKVHHARGNYGQALRNLEQSLEIQRAIGDRAGEGVTLNNISQIHQARGDYGEALGHLDQSLQIRRAIGDRAGEGVTLNNISQIHQARGDYSEALCHLEQSLEIQRAIGDRASSIPTLHNLAHIALAQGDPRRALDYWQEALALAQETGNALGLFHVAGAMGQFLADAGQPEPARELLGRANQVGRSVGLPGVEDLEQALGKLG